MKKKHLRGLGTVIAVLLVLGMVSGFLATTPAIITLAGVWALMALGLWFW